MLSHNQTILNNQLYIQDLDAVSKIITNIELLRNSTFLITGASGLICSAVVDLLIYISDIHNLNITVYAAGRSKEKIESRFEKKVIFVQYDAIKPFSFNEKVDYIIHGAGNANPKLYMQEPVETMIANIIGINNLLEYAKKAKAKKVIFISSSEVYGKKEVAALFAEDQYGYVDLLNVRSCYPIAKRAAETLCCSFAAEHNVLVSIVRPGHIYGPTANVNDSKISSDFSYKAARGEDLIMNSNGRQIRSYCHCLDCATAILYVLLKGKSCEAYNISNEKSVISIREMAEYIAKAGNVKLKFEIPNDQDEKAFNPMQNSSLDSTKLISLGWRGLLSAEDGFAHTVQILSQMI